MNLTEKIVKNLVKLEPAEFLGVCEIVGVRPVDENGDAIEFEQIWSDVVDKIDQLNRVRKRNLDVLVRAAIKGRNK